MKTPAMEGPIIKASATRRFTVVVFMEIEMPNMFRLKYISQGENDQEAKN